MGTKANPAAYDCYQNAAPDEPMFVLLARDPHAALLTQMWAMLREQMIDDGQKPASDLPQVADARQCAYEMQRWRRERKVGRLSNGYLIR